MKRLVPWLLLLLPVAPLHAGVYGDDLTRCVVSSATAGEKLGLVEWMFFAIALNPAVAPLADIPAERRDTADRNTARLFEKLLTETCVEQARAAVKYEGSTAISEAFKLLGQVAAQEMFANPAVSRGRREVRRAYRYREDGAGPGAAAALDRTHGGGLHFPPCWPANRHALPCRR